MARESKCRANGEHSAFGNAQFLPYLYFVHHLFYRRQDICLAAEEKGTQSECKQHCPWYTAIAQVQKNTQTTRLVCQIILDIHSIA